MKINNLDNPIFVFLLFLVTVFINTIASTYFYSIMLCGVLFIAFLVCIKNKYYYSLFFVILSFLFIELNNGFKIFSLSLLALFLYTFVISHIKRLMSFSSFNPYVYIVVFYFFIFVLWAFIYEININLFLIFVINIVIDFLIFGLII